MTGPSDTPSDTAIAAAYRDGETQREIAARFGITRDRVRGALKRAGVAMRPNCPRPMVVDTALEDQVAAAYAAGATYADIRLRFGVAEKRLRTILNDRGIPRHQGYMFSGPRPARTGASAKPKRTRRRVEASPSGFGAAFWSWLQDDLPAPKQTPEERALIDAYAAGTVSAASPPG